MTKTNKNQYKEQRDWNDLLSEKKAYIKRKQEAEDAIKTIRDFNKSLTELLDQDTDAPTR